MNKKYQGQEIHRSFGSPVANCHNSTPMIVGPKCLWVKIKIQYDEIFAEQCEYFVGNRRVTWFIKSQSCTDKHLIRPSWCYSQNSNVTKVEAIRTEVN